ncbi:MAG: hypothetical protein AAF228_05945 [Pseudomonadota bacterium]
MITFLEVARSDGPCSPTGLISSTGLSLSTLSRILGNLGDNPQSHGPGLELILLHKNPENRREKFITLTAKGRILFETLMTIETSFNLR